MNDKNFEKLKVQIGRSIQQCSRAPNSSQFGGPLFWDQIYSKYTLGWSNRKNATWE